MSNVINLNNENFEKEVAQADIPVLVDFWAPWCGPCKMLGPVVESLAADNEGKITVAKLNVDENQNLAVKFGVRGIPTLIFFKGGSEVKRVVGAQSKAQLQKVVDELLA